MARAREPLKGSHFAASSQPARLRCPDEPNPLDRHRREPTSISRADLSLVVGARSLKNRGKLRRSRLVEALARNELSTASTCRRPPHVSPSSPKVRAWSAACARLRRAASETSPRTTRSEPRGAARRRRGTWCVSAITTSGSRPPFGVLMVVSPFLRSVTKTVGAVNQHDVEVSYFD